MYRIKYFLMGILFWSMAGCASIKGIHFHNEADAKKAKSAVEDLEKINLDSVIETGLENMNALAEDQRKVNQDFRDLYWKHFLQQAIGTGELVESPGKAVGNLTASETIGWPVKMLEHLDDNVVNIEISGVQGVLHNLGINRLELFDENAIYEEFVSEYKDTFEGKLDTECKKVPEANSQELNMLLKNSGEPEGTKETFENIATSCTAIKVIKSKIKIAEDAIPASKEYKNIQLNYQLLERELKKLNGTVKKQSEEFNKAKKNLAKAEKELTKAQEGTTQPTPTEPTTENDKEDKKKKSNTCDVAESKVIECWENKITQEVGKIENILDTAKNFPLIGEEIQSDLLVELIGRFDDFKEKLGSPQAKTADKILDIFKEDPAVWNRLVGKETVSINVLLLELSLHQTNYQTALNEKTFKETLMSLYKRQLESFEREVKAWLNLEQSIQEEKEVEQEAIDKNFITQADLDELHASSLEKYYEKGTKATDQMREKITSALASYGVALAFGDNLRTEITNEIAALYRKKGLESSAIALSAWNDMIKAPLQEISLYHQGGITSKEIADFIQAVGLGFIAEGVR